MKKRFLSVFAFVMTICIVTGCAENHEITKTVKSDIAKYEASPLLDVNHIIEQNSPYQYEPGELVFSIAPGFYDSKQSLSISFSDKSKTGTIYYTIDGSKPTAKSNKLSGSIRFMAQSDKLSKIYVVRAFAIYEDGTQSEEIAGTFVVNSDIKNRYSTVVVSIMGNPEDLTDEPDGILYKDNAKSRGEESERKVYVEMFDSSGKALLSQAAGLRPYGGASRESVIKSMKLFARGEYGEKRFKTDVFGAVAKDDITTVSSYKKLVLRNAGNDFQFGYIRDEFNQRLAKAAGYADYEEVLPATVYINGEYYGLLWLHESYCDTYFKKRYGEGEGEFVILEGRERSKDDSGEDGIWQDNTESWSQQFNDYYKYITAYDLKDDDVYADLEKFIDVENYLDYYAFQIYTGNYDWPQNNYKCYRYIAADGEEYGEGVFDGRWRFLLHDTDYCYNLYEQDKTKPEYDNLKHIMSEKYDRYSPLFTKLMQRDSSREYFLNKINSLMETVFKPENAYEILNDLNKERMTEHKIYQNHLDILRKAGESDLWSGLDRLSSDLEDIKTFLLKRPEYMKSFLERLEY